MVKFDDTEYENLRLEWHSRREAWVNDGSPDSGQSMLSFAHIDRKLRDLLWKRCEDDIAADRVKHPKAKRNQPVPLRVEGETHPSRAIP